MKNVKHSIIIPMYNEQEGIAEAYKRLTAVMQGLNESYELIFVNDGSRDKTMEIMCKIAEGDKAVKIVDFARNFGHQIAVTAGLKYCSGEAVVIIDADLQDPPEIIPAMLEKWKEGYQVVYGKRLKRAGETFFKLLTAKMFYRFINKLTGNLVPVDTGDFRLIDRAVVDTMNSMPEHNRFLRGMGSWIGFKQFPFEYERNERFAGETKYPLKKMLKLAKDGIISFSNAPLALASTIGGVMLAGGAIWLLVLIILEIFGIDIESSYLQITLSAMAFCTGLILIGLGLLGEYVGRIYDEVKGRPLFTVMRTINFEE